MLSEQPKKQANYNQGDYNFSLKVIIFLVSLEVLILVGISFVKIYVDKKRSLLNWMRDEVEIVEKTFVDGLDYSGYVLKQMAHLLKYNYDSQDKIESIILHHTPNIMEKKIFGWQSFTWANKSHKVLSVSGEGNILLNSDLSYLGNVILSKIKPNKIFYTPNPDMSDELVNYLDMTIGVTNNAGDYVGSLILQTELSSLIANLELFRRNSKTDFAIIDSRMNIIMTYPLNRTNLGLKGKTITKQNLMKEIAEINFFSKKEIEVSYVDMLSGENFLGRKIKNNPYLILVSQDPDFVKATFTKKVALKFLEIIVLASFFLAIILMVYKRETWLRAKSDKASQIATKAMVAKSDFLSYTAHEIRSPLGFILTGSEIMKKKLFGPIPKKYEEYVEGIHHNAQLILDFINDILNERYIASGNFKIEEDICDLEEIITKAVNTNKTRFHSRNIKITTDIKSKLPKIRGDTRKLVQLISNLISNAYKYSLDNTEIIVSAEYYRGKIKINVLDHGLGMTKEEVKIAMTKYGTTHKNNNENIIESHGLGLHIVAMLVKAHDAKLDIKSEVDQGTQVTITFPKKRIITSKEKKQVN